MLIIGITGTLGAGKGTIVEYLVRRKGFTHYSVRGFIADEILKRGLEVNRDTLTLIANELRAKHSPSYIVDELFKKAMVLGNNCIIESIRTPGEIDSLRSKGKFILFAVDADPKLRYERIVLRNSETDKVSYEDFIASEKREMDSSDPNKQNLGKCIKMADYVFRNNGNIHELEEKVKNVIEKLSESETAGINEPS